MAWFGIRGIGSVYYLTYALNHDFPRAAGAIAADLTIMVVAVSIVLHGLTGQPLLDRYERRLGRQ
jgi:NhaP-type Na+/H+ or K+/H+ antiporter